MTTSGRLAGPKSPLFRRGRRGVGVAREPEAILGPRHPGAAARHRLRRPGRLGHARPTRGHPRVRLSGRRDSPHLRRPAGLGHHARPRAARTGGGAHGGRLRARHRARRRRDGHLGAWRHQPGHRDRHRDDGRLPRRVHHGTGQQQPARPGCLPGGGHHRHHDADHEAQLPGDRRLADRPDAGAGVRHRHVRPPRTRPRGHHEGRAARDLRGPAGGHPLQAHPPHGQAARCLRVRRRADPDRLRETAGDPGGARRARVERRPPAPRLRRTRAASRWPPRCSASAPSRPRTACPSA